MSLVVSSSLDVSNAPYNTSKSKQLFSFSRADRFGANAKPLNENISYDIPSTFSKRGPSLGYGDRTSFFRKNDVPAPTSYRNYSDFDNASPHAKAFSFGIARDAYSKVYIKENPPNDKSIPGPGTYVVPQKVGAEAKKYSMHGRTVNHLLLTTVRHNPGPGAYQPKMDTTSEGKYFIANMKNSGAPTFSLPSLSRFQNDKKDNVPGPGNYNLKIGISDPAYQYVSTFKSPKTRTFYHSDRKTIDILSDHKKFPGPGNYRAPSEFGHYESKNRTFNLKASRSQAVLHQNNTEEDQPPQAL